MNMVNLLLCMWIITIYPEIVKRYKQYDDSKHFQPITLDCAIPASEAEHENGKLSVVLTYKTRYSKKMVKR